MNAKDMLNEKQLTLLLALARRETDIGVSTSPSHTLNSLVKRGLVRKFGTYERKEWNRVVATLVTVYLTEKGRALAAHVAVAKAIQSLAPQA